MAETQWNESSFFEELRRHCSDAAYKAAQELLGWCTESGYKVSYGKGEKNGTLIPSVHDDAKNRDFKLFEVFTRLSGKPGCVLLASHLWAESPFSEDRGRNRLIYQLNKLPVHEPLPPGAVNKRPRLALDSLIDFESLRTFKEVHEWIARELTNSENTLSHDLYEINCQKIETTTKEALINARIGQGQFRERVLKMWGNCCAVTGSTTKDAIRASHIKPWRDSSNDERLDPTNGLPLIASLDALFDAGLISFDQSGAMVVSSLLPSTERTIFSVDGRRLRNSPTTSAAKFLAYHRDNILRK